MDRGTDAMVEEDEDGRRRHRVDYGAVVGDRSAGLKEGQTGLTGAKDGDNGGRGQQGAHVVGPWTRRVVDGCPCPCRWRSDVASVHAGLGRTGGRAGRAEVGGRRGGNSRESKRGEGARALQLWYSKQQRRRDGRDGDELMDVYSKDLVQRPVRWLLLRSDQIWSDQDAAAAEEVAGEQRGREQRAEQGYLQVLRCRVEYGEHWTVPDSWQRQRQWQRAVMTKACRGRIWAMGDLLVPCKIQCDSLGPSNAGARAAISFVEKKSSFLSRVHATGQGP